MITSWRDALRGWGSVAAAAAASRSVGAAHPTVATSLFFCFFRVQLVCVSCPVWQQAPATHDVGCGQRGRVVGVSSRRRQERPPLLSEATPVAVWRWSPHHRGRVATVPRPRWWAMVYDATHLCVSKRGRGGLEGAAAYAGGGKGEGAGRRLGLHPCGWGNSSRRAAARHPNRAAPSRIGTPTRRVAGEVPPPLHAMGLDMGLGSAVLCGWGPLRGGAAEGSFEPQTGGCRGSLPIGSQLPSRTAGVAGGCPARPAVVRLCTFLRGWDGTAADHAILFPSSPMGGPCRVPRPWTHWDQGRRWLVSLWAATEGKHTTVSPPPHRREHNGRDCGRVVPSGVEQCQTLGRAGRARRRATASATRITTGPAGGALCRDVQWGSPRLPLQAPPTGDRRTTYVARQQKARAGGKTALRMRRSGREKKTNRHTGWACRQPDSLRSACCAG